MKYLLSFCSLSCSYLFSQEQSKNYYELRVGGNFSNVNYGREFVTDFLNNEDYASRLSGGDIGAGYQINLGYIRALNPKNEIRLSSGYTELGYDVEGEQSNFNTG